MEVTLGNASELAAQILKAKLMPMLHGSPGIGKSAVVKAIAKQFKLKLIDMRLSQCDPTDLMGFPRIVNGRSGYAPLEDFPLEGDPLPEGYDGWLLFLDELTSAPRAVQAPAYKLILDRMVGNRKLHSRVLLAGAGNLSTDGAIVEEMSTALQSRMVHLIVKLDNKQWLNWAESNRLDHRITSFLEFRPDKLYTFKPDHSDLTYACPRTWEFTHDLLGVTSTVTSKNMAMYAGALSEGVAREFAAHCELEDRIPKIQQILNAPETIAVPGEPSYLYALSGALAANADEDNCSGLMKYVRRMPGEFQIRVMRSMCKRTPAMFSHPDVAAWINKSSHDFLS